MDARSKSIELIGMACSVLIDDPGDTIYNHLAIEIDRAFDRDAEWLAAVDELEQKMHPDTRPESMPWDAVAGYYQALEELKSKMAR